MTTKLKLTERTPFFYKGNCTWYEAGQVFERLEARQMPSDKFVFYRVSVFGFELDGWVNSKYFEVIG